MEQKNSNQLLDVSCIGKGQVVNKFVMETTIKRIIPQIKRNRKKKWNGYTLEDAYVIA